MVIITPATDGSRGNNFNRPEDKSKEKGTRVGGAIVTPLTMPPLKGGRRPTEELPEGAVTPGSETTPLDSAGNTAKATASAVTIDEIFSTPSSATGGSASESLSNESPDGHSKEAAYKAAHGEFVDDDWEAPSELQDFIKEGRGPGRPRGTLWNSDGYPPALLSLLLFQHYGREWLIWEPETLRSEIIDDYHTTLSDRVFEKIMALRVCYSTQAPWKEWDIFQNVCLAFNDIPVDFDYTQYVSPAQIAYTLDQISRLRKEEFDDDIKAYIATICYEEGFVWLPELLDIAQEYLDKLNAPNAEFKREVQEIWSTIQNKDLTTWPFKEDKLGIQLSRIAAIKLYRENKVQAFAQELDGYEGTT